jgi:hypothetical protein
MDPRIVEWETNPKDERTKNQIKKDGNQRSQGKDNPGFNAPIQRNKVSPH